MTICMHIDILVARINIVRAVSQRTGEEVNRSLDSGDGSVDYSDMLAAIETFGPFAFTRSNRAGRGTV